jgi:hypothetical protein
LRSFLGREWLFIALNTAIFAARRKRNTLTFSNLTYLLLKCQAVSINFIKLMSVREEILCYPELMAFYQTRSMQQKSKWRLVIQLVPLILIVIASAVGIWQLKAVREFFGHAAGENANLIVDTQAVLGPMPRPWRNLGQGGESFSWQLKPLVPQVRALKPEYIRIDHIYDFYNIVGGTSGNLTFDFSKLDTVISDIRATGAKPYIALSYMPPAISASDILDKPRSWTDWQIVVQKTIEHVSGTLGISDVYYEVWNEPDLFGGWKYYGNKNYLTLYEYAARGAQSARGVQPFKIGGPAITALYKEWFDALSKDAINNNVRLDFFSWHRYTKDLEQYKKDMFNVKTWVQNYPQLEPTLEFHITEWGINGDVDPGYDTAYGAAHAAASAISMINVVDRAFTFEIQDGRDPKGQNYWGRWGLFTSPEAGAAAKPRYNALRMLDRISDQRLQILGNGTWVKATAARSDAGTTQVVLANFDPRSSHSESVPITFQNIDPGTYTVRKDFLNGARQTEVVATTAAELQVHVAMPINSVGFVELTKNQ